MLAGALVYSLIAIIAAARYLSVRKPESRSLEPVSILKPLAGLDAVRELKAYFEYLYSEARARYADGMTALAAARSISLDRWADWGEPERLVVNIANIYSELAGDHEPVNPMAAFQQMAELARAS